ncbi:MAG: L-seryl-tRNA(Sec) selenium transferase [Candidatus Electronema sp. V4]|uniref:L-seryl-tRNA(Sec) selenium transferase n=1 Tax=Candidatus Electronema sp. V4 TaxID=3454756 RepID=UPI0040553A88
MHDLLRRIPAVDDCLLTILRDESFAEIPAGLLKKGIRVVLEAQRQEILSGKEIAADALALPVLLSQIKAAILALNQPRFRRVINATGVIIHTNLGRSVLPESAALVLAQAAVNYSNLEFDLAAGKRGSRYALVEELLCELSGAEAALVVNNNAAAVLIALDTLAKGKEAIVSRGQLVEIGGSFRIPEVMARSGAKLVEVGATNRTHLKDYQQAINAETGLLLKVHTSNYRIIGFTSAVSNEELVQLGHEHNLPVMEDLGSGCLVDLSPFGLEKEPTVQEVVASGVDVVTFSGDKLLGGPQAGIILGKREIIDQIKKNPLNRALRIDKFTLAGLEAVLRLYRDPKTVCARIPTLQMISAPLALVGQRAEQLVALLQERISKFCAVRMVDTLAQVGGGAMPEQHLVSRGVELRPSFMRVSRLEKELRSLAVPVIGRIEDDRLLLDMRTVREDELILIAEGLEQIFQRGD